MSKQRKIRFIIFLLIFLAVSPFVLMYSFGNLFNGRSFLKTGGIYVITGEPDCEIYLDGKLKKTSNFFQRSFLIKNLSSKKYSILVKKTGLNSWEKDVSVLDGLVTEIKPLMLPEKVELREIPKIIEVFNSTATTTKKNQEYEDVLKLFLSNDSQALSKQNNTKATTSIKFEIGTEENPIIYRSVGLWSDNDKVYVSWLGKDASIPESFCNNSKCEPFLEVYDFKNKVEQVNFLLGDRDAVLALSSGCLYALEVQQNDKKKAQNIYCGEETDFLVEEKNFLYIKDGVSLFEVMI